MANIFVYSREAIRVKVKKCEGFLQPEYRKFSVDPQITSFEVLQSLLAKAFDIKGDFTVCYRTFDDYGQETFLPLLSDWDLDAAFLSASDPYLCLQVDMKPFEESTDEWDVGPIDVVRTPAPENKPQNRLPGLIMNQVERTFNMVQRALNLVEDQQSSVGSQPPRPPLADAEFRKFLDPIGQVVQSRELRTVIYLGGIEPSLRKVVWKHILNVYPDGLSGKERMDYMKKKALEYQNLRDCWRNMVQNGQVTGDLAYVTSMVRKDVLRTDRHHRFYAGSDDNQNIASLFNILTTYALNHPTVSYCQGMSDLASPLLVTMGDEAHAYICFCALMRRLHSNFLLDGVTMTLKFQHLAEGLMYYDPEFYAYLKGHQADDLLFCYRWLLLEMKREFAFDDALRMLEVLWSSLPQMPPDKDLPLFERCFSSQSPPVPGSSPPPISPLLKTPRENAYTKVCALRRQSSAVSLSHGTKRGAYRQNQSLDETATGSHGRPANGVKQFASLDDTSLQFLSHCQDPKSRSMSPAEALSEPENETSAKVNHQINSKTSPPKREISVSTGSLLSKVAEKKVRLKELKKRFATERSRSVFSSFDKSLSDSSKVECPFNDEKKRVVKNLNEFLNFACLNKNRLLQSITPKQEVCQLVRESSVISEDSDKTLSGDCDSPKGNVAEDGVEFSKPEACDLTPQNELRNEDNEIKLLTYNSLVDKSGDDAACDCSSPDDSAEYFPMTTSMTRELRLELENLDRQVFGLKFRHRSLTLEDSEELESPCSESFRSIELKIESGGTVERCDCVLSKQESDLPSEDTTTEVAEICSTPLPLLGKPSGLILNLNESWHQPTLWQLNSTDEQKSEFHVAKDNFEVKEKSCGLNMKLNKSSQNFSPAPTLTAGEEIFVWENPLQCPTTPDEQADLEYDGTVSSIEGDSCFNSSVSAGEIFETEGQGVKSVTPIRLLRSVVHRAGSAQCRNHIEPPGSPTDDTSDSSEGWGGKGGQTHSDFEAVGGKSGSNVSKSKGRGLTEIPQSAAGCGASSVNSCEEVIEQGSASNLCSQQTSSPPRQLPSNANIHVQLPPPHKFGDGNPFLMFLCLTVLLQHRDYIMRSGMDYNEMAMHFDKMVRKHNVTRVLNHARQMYTAYLRHQASINNNTSGTGVDLNV